MKIVAVTACPTGIAHTYMAQEALEKKSRLKGHRCHVETQGSIGVESELSQTEIDEADVVIMAVEMVVEGMERFENKIIYEADIADCITNTEEVIDKALELVK